MYYNCAAVVAVLVRFLVLTRVVPLLPILSAIPRNLRELIPSDFSMIDYGTDCPNNRLRCLYEFVQGCCSQD